MLMRGSTEDQNHNPYILLELSFLIIFHKSCFLCHILVYKWCLNTRSAFEEHSLLAAIFLMCFSWILYVSATRCPLILLSSADIWMMGINKASDNSNFILHRSEMSPCLYIWLMNKHSFISLCKMINKRKRLTMG